MAWDRVTRILDGWHQAEAEAQHSGEPLTLPQYPAGSWGPAAADELLQRDGRHWRNEAPKSE